MSTPQPAYLNSLQIGAAKLFDVYGDVITTLQQGANFYSGNAAVSSGKVVVLDQTITLLNSGGVARPSSSTADCAFVLAQVDPLAVASVTVNTYALSNMSGAFAANYSVYENANITYNSEAAAQTSMNAVQADPSFLKSSSLPLYDGVNVMSITVTPSAANYTAVTYLITVVLVSNNTHLISLVPDVALYQYEPTFDSNYNSAISVVARSLELAPSVTSIRLTPTTENSSASIRITANGSSQSVASGSLSAPISIVDGTVITVAVTAVDNFTTQTWLVTVNYADITNYLSSVAYGFIKYDNTTVVTFDNNDDTVWANEITPADANLETEFVFANFQSVDYNATYLNIVATADDANAYVSMVVNGGAESALYMGSNTFKYACNKLSRGENTVVINVYNALGVASNSYSMTYFYPIAAPFIADMVSAVGSINPVFEATNITRQDMLSPIDLLADSSLYTNYVANIGGGNTEAELILTLADAGCQISYSMNNTTWTTVPLVPPVLPANQSASNWYNDKPNSQMSLFLTGILPTLFIPDNTNTANSHVFIMINAPGADSPSSSNYVYYNVQFINPSVYLNSLNIYNVGNPNALVLNPAFDSNVNVYDCTISTDLNQVSSVNMKISWSGNYTAAWSIDGVTYSPISNNVVTLLDFGSVQPHYNLIIRMIVSGSETVANLYNVTLYNVSETVLLNGLLAYSATSLTNPAGDSLISISPSFSPYVFVYNTQNPQKFGAIAPSVANPSQSIITVNGNVVLSGQRWRFSQSAARVPLIVRVTDANNPSMYTEYQVVFNSSSSNVNLNVLTFQNISNLGWTPRNIGTNLLSPFVPAIYTSPHIYDISTTNVMVNPDQAGSLCYLYNEQEPGFVLLTPGVWSEDIQIYAGAQNNIKVYVYPNNLTSPVGLFSINLESQTSTNANVTSITMSNTGLVYNPAVLSYNLTLDEAASDTLLQAVAENAYALLQYRIASGAWNTLPVYGATIPILVSSTTQIQVKCTAQDGINTKTYTFIVTRNPNSKATGIAVGSDGSENDPTLFALTPAFNPNTFVYSTFVGATATNAWVFIHHTTESTVSTTSDATLVASTSTRAVYKVPVPPHVLNVSSNPVAFTIAATGVPSNTYYINIVRPVNSVVLDGLNLYDSLDNLIPLTPAFNGQIYSYQIPSIFNGHLIRVNVVGRPASFTYYINGVNVTNTTVLISNSVPLNIAVQPIGNPSITTLYNVAPTL